VNVPFQGVKMAKSRKKTYGKKRTALAAARKRGGSVYRIKGGKYRVSSSRKRRGKRARRR
jgi:hypothetical protein